MVYHIDISRNNSPECKDPYMDEYGLRVSIPLWQVCNFITALILRRYVSDYEEHSNYTLSNYRFLPFYPDNNFHEDSKYKIWAIDFLSVVLYHLDINKQIGGNER